VAAIDVVAGTASTAYTAVGPGEVVVVTNFSLRYSQANAFRVELRAVLGGLAIILRSRATLVALDSIDIQCNIVLKEGDYLSFYYNNAAVGDDFFSYACGYKMLIAE